MPGIQDYQLAERYLKRSGSLYNLVGIVDTLATVTESVVVVNPTVGGFPVAVGTRMLLTNQSSPILNGIYAATGGAGAAAPRATDLDASDEFFIGDAWLVTGGDHQGEIWKLSALTGSPFVLGTNDITFTQVVGVTAERHRPLLAAVETPDIATDVYTFTGAAPLAGDMAVYVNGVRYILGVHFTHTDFDDFITWIDPITHPIAGGRVEAEWWQ